MTEQKWTDEDGNRLEVSEVFMTLKQFRKYYLLRYGTVSAGDEEGPLTMEQLIEVYCRKN